jgi:hypothetical protein
VSDPQTRRSFLGLISAVSAALAAGVRLPDAPIAKAAGTAPVEPWSDDEAMFLDAPPVRPPDRTPAGLLAMLREMLPQCVAVAWEQNIIVGELLETRVTYSLDPEKAQSNRNPMGVDLDRVERGWPSAVTITDNTPYEDVPVTDLVPQRVWCKTGPTTREITIAWRG